MKKLFFGLMLASTISCFCQQMGLKAGANIGKEKLTANGLNVTSESSVFFMVGFFISEKFTDQFSIGSELLYSLDGGKYNLVGFGFSGGSFTHRYHYISIPVLLKFHASDFFNISVGPQAGYLVKAEVENDRTREDFTSDVNPLNGSLVFGAEVNLRAFDLGFRYVLGLSDLNGTDDNSFQVKLNTIQIYLGQTF
ncbi:MAG: porin family protein [Bacteroidota bacterium]